MAKERLDKLLIDLELAENIDKARRLVMAGKVVVNDHRIDKPGTKIDTNSEIRLKKQIPYVSRGGLKLEKAVKTFSVDINNKIVMDIGASTGGFTDVALKYGAKKVYAVDVGKAQLHHKLLTDDRVVNLENTNFRYLPEDVINDKVDLFVTDVSFISLTKIIPKIYELSGENSIFIPLIKPQFEAEKNQVENKGLVTNPETHKNIILKIYEFALKHSFELKGLIKSPVKGAKGNTEYLAYFKYCDKKELKFEKNIDEIVKKVVYENHCHNS